MCFLSRRTMPPFSHVIMVLRTRDPAHKAQEAPGMEFGDGASAPAGAPHHLMISNEHPDSRGKASAVKHDLGKYRHARWTPPQSGFPFGR